MSAVNNFPMLADVRSDALEKAKNSEYGEFFFDVIYQMCRMNELARKEGLLAIEFAEPPIPHDIKFYDEIHAALQHITDGWENDRLAETLIRQYREKKLQGADALLYYLIIYSALGILTPGFSSEQLEKELLSYIPDEFAKKYLEYKRRFTEK